MNEKVISEVLEAMSAADAQGDDVLFEDVGRLVPGKMQMGPVDAAALIFLGKAWWDANSERVKQSICGKSEIKELSDATSKSVIDAVFAILTIEHKFGEAIAVVLTAIAIRKTSSRMVQFPPTEGRLVVKTYSPAPDIGDDFFHWAARTMALNYGRITRQDISLSISQIEHTHLGGDVGRDGSTVEIRHDRRLEHDVNLVVKALLTDPTALQCLGERKLIPANAEQAQSLEVAPHKIKETSYGIVQDILRLGPGELLGRNERADHFICKIFNGLLSSDALKIQIAKCASGAALCFLLQHEFSHAILHHTKYDANYSKSPFCF